jgi:glucose-1-phosphate cytidylyltransferase
MKAVILAGGLGTRLSEETYLKPKPMVEIGNMPILWHIMKIYSHYGINDFVICLGYKGYMIKEFFSNFLLHSSDVTIDLQQNKIEIINSKSESWKITLVDTGDDTMTGGRLKRIQKYIDDTFCLTYGDGLSDIDISSTIELHKKNNLIGTITAVDPVGRFGVLDISENKVVGFQEKPKNSESLINGGFFVLEPKIFDYLKDDTTILEREPLEKLSKEGQLGVYHHKGFWLPMDTLRDKKKLDELWSNPNPPWKKW